MGAYKQQRLSKSSNPSNKQPGRGSGDSDRPSIEWVRYSFSPADKERIQSSELDISRCIDTLARMVEQGHKITFSPVNGNGFYGASLFGHTDECVNKGYGVSGEGGSFYSALKSLYWKLELLDYDLHTTTITNEDDFR